MVALQDIIQIKLTEADIKTCIQRALGSITISQLDNLRNRHANIQFDCILRGYIGEFAFLKWLEEFDIFITEKNLVADGDAMDIDFFYKNKNIELKTSLLPDSDKVIENVIAKRDIKLIKRSDTINNLKGDIHIQFYFIQKRKAKDQWLQNQKIDLQNTNMDYLYDAFAARVYTDTTYFVAWITKHQLCKAYEKLNPQSQFWSFTGSKRQFWKCNIQLANQPLQFIEYLKRLP